MYITVSDALQLERFQRFKLVAGHNGLHRRIEKISLLDYEILNRIEGQFLKNEFALSSLLGAKDDPSLIIGSVKYLVQSGVSGLAVKNIYFDRLPDEVIEYADNCDFPIFIFDNSVFFEDIITDIRDVLRDLEKGTELEYQLNSMLESNVSGEDITSLFHKTIGFFKSPFLVVYFREHAGAVNSDLLSVMEHFRSIRSDTIKGLFRFNRGLLMVYASESCNEATYKADLAYLGINKENYYIGRSIIFDHESSYKAAVQQAVWASRAACAEGLGEMCYQDIGVYKLIIPFFENNLYEEFLQQTLQPIIDYDHKHGTGLFETARLYITYGGDIFKTAHELFQHSNTIRYRINKVRSLMGLDDSEVAFHERLSVAFRILKLNSSGF
ncbi:MAG: PucR family transcriptional regulator [Pseudomonadota bacterium]